MSFKLKLVAYFLLVSLLPLGAAAWGLHAVAWKSETRGVDVRLEAGLRAVPAADNRLLGGVLATLVLIGLVAYVVGGSIVVSLGRLSDAANAIARGRLDRRVDVDGRDEFARLGLAFNEMADQLEGRMKELAAERGRLRDATVRFGEALAATLDVDQLLRVIVETVGDAVLVEFAETLRECVREIDLAARWGGEEFGVLLPGTDLEGATRLAERMRTTFEQRTILAPDGSPIRVTVSLGVAAFPETSTGDDIVAAADAALYAAKRLGKNRVVAARPRARQA